MFLQSRNGKPLGRYFPELVLPRRPLRARRRDRRARRRGREDFDALGQRIHPAVSRDRAASVETPAVFVVFDLLAYEDDRCWSTLRERRAALEDCSRRTAFADCAGRADGVRRHAGGAERWLEHAEGAIAKERSAPYRPGERKGTFKVKRVRTIDAVVVGWRPGKEPDTVGALILGLYDGPELRVVGHCSGLTAAEKRRLVGFLAPYESGERGSADPAAGAR